MRCSHILSLISMRYSHILSFWIQLGNFVIVFPRKCFDKSQETKRERCSLRWDTHIFSHSEFKLVTLLLLSHVNVLESGESKKSNANLNTNMTSFYISQVASGSDKGRELEAIMKEGKLVSNEAVLCLLAKAIAAHKCDSKGFLIDGCVTIAFYFISKDY